MSYGFSAWQCEMSDAVFRMAFCAARARLAISFKTPALVGVSLS